MRNRSVVNDCAIHSKLPIIHMPKIPLIFGWSKQRDRLPLTYSARTTICAVACLAALIFPGSLFAADEKVEFPAASQHAVVKQRVGLTDIEVDYSRPNKNNRTIFGGLVPFDKPWRTGANQPTKIKTSAPVKLGDKEIPAGEYVLYTIPGANEWAIVFSKNLKAQSLAEHKAEDEAARVTAKPVTVASPAETFTIGFEDLRADSATLYLEWDKTRVPVKLMTNDVEKVSKGIDAAVKGGKPQEAGFYYSAASFYLDQNKDLPQALKWVDQAIEKNPKAYFMHSKKAQILAKMGNKKEAIAAAEKSIEILQAEPNPDASAIGANRTLIDSLR
jgi:tetratricopeptide (TPR) repeat protein